LLQQTLARRPQGAEASREKARADVNLARAKAWWDFAPRVQYHRIGPDNTFGVISIPSRLFDWNQGEIARTRGEVQRADQLCDVVINRPVLSGGASFRF
jgi:hypothetical protein